MRALHIHSGGKILARALQAAALLGCSLPACAEYHAYFYTGPPMTGSFSESGTVRVHGEFRFSEPLAPGESIIGTDRRLIYARVVAGGFGGILEHPSYLLPNMTMGTDGLPIQGDMRYEGGVYPYWTRIYSAGRDGYVHDEITVYNRFGNSWSASSHGGNGVWTGVQVVPEPSTLSLWGLAGLFFLGLRHGVRSQVPRSRASVI